MWAKDGDEHLYGGGYSSKIRNTSPQHQPTCDVTEGRTQTSQKPLLVRVLRIQPLVVRTSSGGRADSCQRHRLL